jgi:ribosomal protein L14
MLQTMLNCIDNSGAAIVECVAVMRKKRQAARIGMDRIQDMRKRNPLTPIPQEIGSLLSCRNRDHSDLKTQAVLAWVSPTGYEEGIFDMLWW